MRSCPRCSRASGTDTRAHGAFDPSAGLRTNAAKILLDPYAKAVGGDVKWDEACFGYPWADPTARNDLDSASFAPKSVVINPYFDRADDRAPRTPYNRTVIYEAPRQRPPFLVAGYHFGPRTGMN